MNPQLLQYFAKGELYNMSWVILLFFANDYIKTDRTIAIICIVGAIALAALKVVHKSEHITTITNTPQKTEINSPSNPNETE